MRGRGRRSVRSCQSPDHPHRPTPVFFPLRAFRLDGPWAQWPVEAFALDSYDVFVDSKKFTSSRVSFAVAIHLAGFATLYSASNPSSSSRRSARYLTYWLM